MLSRFVISFLPRSKHLNFVAAVTALILEPKKTKSVTVSTSSSSICYEGMGPNAQNYLTVFLLMISQVSYQMPYSQAS